MPLPTGRRLPLRLVIGALLLGALLGPRLPLGGPRSLPVLVVDVSASAGPGPFGPPPDAEVQDRWIAFAETAAEVAGRVEPPAIGREATRLGPALRMAAARWPGRDVWLMTDGRDTGGDGEDAARAVVAAGGRLFVSPPRQPPADVGLVEARVRREAGAALVDVLVASSTPGTARVTLVREGRLVAEAPLRLAPGAVLRVGLEERPAPEGAARYEVVLEHGPGTPDDDPGNQRLEVGLPAPWPAVGIWGDLAWGAGVEPPAEVRRLEGWREALAGDLDALVLSDVPWTRIGPEGAAALADFAAGGGRVLVLGGPRGWRAAGWAGTPLEDGVLPLRCRREEGPGLALLLLLDRSGSTASGALDHLRRAVRSALEALGPGESLAVLPFAGAPDAAPLAPGWVVAGDEAGAATLLASVADVVPGGSTDLAGALSAGADLVGRREARARRVLLLTDGDPDHAPDEDALRRARLRLDARGAEAGAIVRGMPLAAERLRALVATRPGAVVLLDDAARIPEALLERVAAERAGEDAVDGPLEVAWAEGEGPEPRRATGIHDLEPVEGAAVIAAARRPAGGPEAWPFAGRRALGAGAVVALAWGPGLEADASAAGAAVLATAARLAAEADRGLEGAFVDGRLEVRVPAGGSHGLLGVLVPPGNAPLVEVGPGLFAGPEPHGDPPWLVAGPAGGAEGARPLRVPARPRPEHRGAGVDEVRLQALARAGGGARLAAGREPPPGRRGPGLPLAPGLLLLAALLLVVERGIGGGEGMAARSKGEGGSS